MTRCAKCKVRMRRGLLVQRIQDYVFHLDCFVCSLCNRRLQFGELIGFVDGEIFCAEHVRTFPLAPSPSSVFTKSPPKPTESGHLASADHSLRDVLFRAGSFPSIYSSAVILNLLTLLRLRLEIQKRLASNLD